MSEVSLSKLTYFNLVRHHLLEPAPGMGPSKSSTTSLGLNAQGALKYTSLLCRVGGLEWASG